MSTSVDGQQKTIPELHLRYFLSLGRLIDGLLNIHTRQRCTSSMSRHTKEGRRRLREVGNNGNIERHKCLDWVLHRVLCSIHSGTRVEERARKVFLGKVQSYRPIRHHVRVRAVRTANTVLKIPSSVPTCCRRQP